MRLAFVPHRAAKPIERLADALTDPKSRDRVMILVLLGYVAIWTLYGAIAKGSQDVHFDMGEIVAWSREPAWGTPKHPPLSAWLVKAWFTVFPLEDWAYYLFAMVVAGSGLLIAWLVSGRYLDGDRRVAGLAVLTLVPFFNFHALKFNANTVLIPVWGLTTLFFLRSFETRKAGAAALAGFFAAAAMYGKYWSAVLIIGLGIAALADPRRGAYLRSCAPWVTIATGTLALSPHVAWLIANDFSPFHYALATHPAESTAAVIVAAIGFLGGTLGYMAVPAAIAFIIARPTRSAIVDTAWPAAPDRRLVALAFWSPLLVATLAALAAGAMIVSLWMIPAFTLLPVVLMSSPQIIVPRIAVVRLLAVAIAMPVVCTLAAPGIATVIHLNGLPNHAAHYRLLAAAVERAWHDRIEQPLRLVGGIDTVINGVVFYATDRPSTYEIVGPQTTPWADEARIARDGMALVCPMNEARCLGPVEAFAARHATSGRVEVDISRTYLGVPDRPERYLIIIVAPRA
jgi:4-amino-4-deoxy-L-arabinose transferase-like glycosyltransferase